MELARILGYGGSGGEVLGGLLSGFPVVRDEFLEPLGGMGADALEDIPKVGEGIHTEPFPCGNEACASRRCPLLEMT